MGFTKHISIVALTLNILCFSFCEGYVTEKTYASNFKQSGSSYSFKRASGFSIDREIDKSRIKKRNNDNKEDVQHPFLKDKLHKKLKEKLKKRVNKTSMESDLPMSEIELYENESSNHDNCEYYYVSTPNGNIDKIYLLLSELRDKVNVESYGLSGYSAFCEHIDNIFADLISMKKIVNEINKNSFDNSLFKIGTFIVPSSHLWEI